MNGVEINTRAYVATRLLLRWDYLYAVTLKTKVFGDYNHARLEVSWITSTRGLLLCGYTGLHLDMLDAARSPNMQSAFLPELHRRISKLTARHVHACPPGDLLITMVKETVILYKKEFRKMKKSRIPHWSERDDNAKWLRGCLWLCQACKRGFPCRPMWRNLRQEAHSYPQADICSAPLSPS